MACLPAVPAHQADEMCIRDRGRTSVKRMWSEKKGAAYDAVVVLDDTGEKYVRFKLEFPKRKEGVNGKK